MGTRANTIPEQAVATRRAFVERYAGTDTLVLGSHFTRPPVGSGVRSVAGGSTPPATASCRPESVKRIVRDRQERLVVQP